jgi:hypothetical protein
LVPQLAQNSAFGAVQLLDDGGATLGQRFAFRSGGASHFGQQALTPSRQLDSLSIARSSSVP